jgi:hypothetical protein
MAKAKGVLSTPPTNTSATTDRPDDTNLSVSRKPRGKSANAAIVPAVGPHDDGRSDNVECNEKESPSAPLAQPPHRNTAMNTIVSPEAITSATAIPNRSVTLPDPVYEIIEAHRAASAAYDKAVNHPAVGDDSHPDCKQATRISNQTMQTLFRQANRLFKFSPTTASGLVTMLQYISSLEVWEMPSHLSEPREVKGLKALCAAMAAGLKRDGDLSIPSLAAGPDAELLGWIDQLWALVPRYWQIHAQYEAQEKQWFKRRPSDDAEPDAAMTAAEIPYNQFQEEMDELERKVFSTRARTLAGVKAKARWHLQFRCGGDIEQLDGSHCHVESLFLELGGQEIDPGLVPAAMTDLQKSHPDAVLLDPVDGEADRRPKSAVDPVFAAIEAHRSAYAHWLRDLDDADKDAALSAADHAAGALLEAEPKTLAGAAALLAYFSECTIRDDTYFPEGHRGQEGSEEEMIPFAAKLAQVAGRAISKSIARSASGLDSRS